MLDEKIDVENTVQSVEAVAEAPTTVTEAPSTVTEEPQTPKTEEDEHRSTINEAVESVLSGMALKTAAERKKATDIATKASEKMLETVERKVKEYGDKHKADVERMLEIEKIPEVKDEELADEVREVIDNEKLGLDDYQVRALRNALKRSNPRSYMKVAPGTATPQAVPVAQANPFRGADGKIRPENAADYIRNMIMKGNPS